MSNAPVQPVASAQEVAASAAAPRAGRQTYRFFARYGTVVGMLLMIVLFSALRPEVFPTVRNFLTILRGGADLTVVALGLTAVLVIGEFDLSIGAVASFSTMVVTTLMAKNHLPMPVALLFTLAMGAVIGLINGWVVTKIGVSAFIASLAMMSVITGVNFWYGQGMPVTSGIPPAFLTVGQGRIADLVPVNILVMLAIALLMWLLLNHTVLGRQMYAVGGNAEASKLSGVNVTFVRTMAFVLCGLLATAAGVMLASRLGQGHPTGADGFMLDAFTAAFLGAATLREGEFNVAGTVLAVFMVSMIANGLTMLGAQFFFQNIIKGLLLVGAVALSGVGRKFFN